MYREVWRIERDFFYDPGLHGLDLTTSRHAMSRISTGSSAGRT